MRLRADVSWWGDLNEDEREIFLNAARAYLRLRCARPTGCDLEDEQTRLTMALRVLGRIGKMPN